MFPSLLNALAAWLIDGAGMLASFVTGGGAFPKPLRPEEEQRLLLKKQAGEEEARNILIERNLRLVAHIVKKFSNTGEDTEDLISIGVIGLIKAINTFDPQKKTRLATYAARCIENENSLSKGKFNFNFSVCGDSVGRVMNRQPAISTTRLLDFHLLFPYSNLQHVFSKAQFKGIAVPGFG